MHIDISQCPPSIRDRYVSSERFSPLLAACHLHGYSNDTYSCTSTRSIQSSFRRANTIMSCLPSRTPCCVKGSGWGWWWEWERSRLFAIRQNETNVQKSSKDFWGRIPLSWLQRLPEAQVRECILLRLYFSQNLRHELSDQACIT